MNVELLDEPAQTTALTAPQRAAVALSSAQTRADLSELVKKSVNIVAVLNADGRSECHAAAMALVKARTTIERVGKTAREDATAFSKAVIAEEKSLVAITAAEEARLLALRNEWDNARAKEKEEAERVERERITKIHLRIADIRAVVWLAQQADHPECYDMLDRLEAFRVEGFDEFTDEATAALAETIATVTSIHDAKAAADAERRRIKMEQDAERLRLAAERAELDRQRAEQAAAKAAADAQALRDAAEITRQRDALMAEVAAANKAQQEARAALEAELSMMRAALAEPAEPEEPVPVVVQTIEVLNEIDEPITFEFTDEETARECAHFAAEFLCCTPAEALVRLAGIDWSNITMGEEA